MIENNQPPREFMSIQFVDLEVGKLSAGMGFDQLVNSMFEDTQNDLNNEVRVIERPTFTFINGKEAGTFVYTWKDKYDSEAVAWGHQDWIVDAVDHGYFIGFTAPPETFDSPDNIQIREQFVKSIKFLQ